MSGFTPPELGIASVSQHNPTPLVESTVQADILPSQEPLSLHQPVLIPQRRPGSKERGFIQAYAPCLKDHGISQDDFVDFIIECNLALQGSASVQAVRVTASLVSLVPDPSGISNAVGAGLGLAAAAAAVIQSNWKTNTFLDKHNEEMFLPRGLFCIIVTHDPVETNTTTASTALSTREETTLVASKISTPAWMDKVKDPYRKSSSGLPLDVAPLTYHEDQVRVTHEPPKTTGGFRKFMSSMDSYLDNRALAQYTVSNDSDAIVKAQPRPATFRSRYLDPTHPATTGGLVGLLSGGRVTDKGLEALSPLNLLQQQILAATRGKDAVGEKNVVLDEEERKREVMERERILGKQVARLSVAQRAKVNKGCGGAGAQAFKKSILYLTLVSLEAAKQFTTRGADTAPYADGGEGIGEAISSLMGEMAQGIVII